MALPLPYRIVPSSWASRNAAHRPRRPSHHDRVAPHHCAHRREAAGVQWPFPTVMGPTCPSSMLLGPVRAMAPGAVAPARSAANPGNHGRPRSFRPQQTLRVARSSSSHTITTPRDFPNSSRCSSHSFRRTDASARRSSRVSHLGSVDPCRRSLLAVPLRARAAVVHWRSSETNCRVRRLLLVAAHRCARPMSLRGLGYAGPLVAALRAAALVAAMHSSRRGPGTEMRRWCSRVRAVGGGGRPRHSSALEQG